MAGNKKTLQQLDLGNGGVFADLGNIKEHTHCIISACTVSKAAWVRLEASCISAPAFFSLRVRTVPLMLAGTIF